MQGRWNILKLSTKIFELWWSNSVHKQI